MRSGWWRAASTARVESPVIAWTSLSGVSRNWPDNRAKGREEQVDLITAFSTDSRIEGYNLILLEDDRKYFPPYFAAPVIRRQTLSRYPEIKEALAPIENLLDEETMRRLNFEVDQKKRQFARVVQEFLEAQGLGADK
ncbi:MAG: glycine betaine ABC transporter substrate-binding protein [Desulfobulbales bacterium]|nr:glycine betaine ABC transporter substrate-binding protein [Desulfobulbales bacterium]